MNHEEYKESKYRNGMDRIHAPENLTKKVKNLDYNTKVKNFKLRKLAYTAAILVVVFVSSNLVACAATGNTWVEEIVKRTVFFVDTKEDLLAKKQKENSDNKNSKPGNSYWIIEEYQEDFNIYNIYKYCSNSFTVNSEETLISDEIGTADESWTRKMVVSCEKGYASPLTKKYYTGNNLTGLITYQPLIKNWDLSWLDKNYTADTNGQLLKVYWNQSTGELDYSFLYGLYYTKKGGIIILQSSYDAKTPYANDYVNSNDVDFSEYYTTADGVEFVIMGKGNKILGEVCMDNFDCTLCTENVSAKEVKEIADHINLASLVKAYE